MAKRKRGPLVPLSAYSRIDYAPTSTTAAERFPHRLRCEFKPSPCPNAVEFLFRRAPGDSVRYACAEAVFAEDVLFGGHLDFVARIFTPEGKAIGCP